VVSRAFVVVYEAVAGRIRTARVLHAARDLPGLGFGDDHDGQAEINES
jgi:hypothetical protein